METFLFIVFFVSCIVLIISVLLQPGKTDAGALFTSGVSSAALNPRGTASVLSKLTIGAATVFMLSALFLSMPALTGNVSVLDTQAEKGAAPAANTNSADANANSKSETNTAAPKPAESKTVDSKPAGNQDPKPESKTAETKDEKKEEKK